MQQLYLKNLANAAKMSETSVETFIEKLGLMGIAVINHTSDELERDLQNLG